MIRTAKRFISVFLLLSVMLSCFSVLTVNAATYKMSSQTSQGILDTITSKYSKRLSDSISDLFYNSDYSVFMPGDKQTFRNYYSNGNSKSWPASNADNYIYSVKDRGNLVNWGWGSAGCMSYSNFFAYSIYGTMGKSLKDTELVSLSFGNESVLKTYLKNHANPGEHIRIAKYNSDNKMYGVHSVNYLCDAIVNNEEGFYIAEYWGGAKKNEQKVYVYNEDNDQYYIKFYTYKSFIEKYLDAVCYIYDAYETSDYITEVPSAPVVGKTRDIILVLDVSGSMYGTPLSNTKTAAKQFVDQILDNGHDTRIALVTYDSNARTIVELTDDKTTLKTAIDLLDDLYSTNMYEGLYMAGNILEESAADKKSIVIMTDGEANMGVTAASGQFVTAEGDSVYFNSYAAAIYNLSQTYINDKNYTIYSLGFGLSENSNAYNLIKYISSFNKLNERYFWSVTNENIDDIVFTYEDIADTIVTKKNIIISIECPVDVEISLGNEKLNINNKVASFGTLTVEPVSDGNSYLFNVEDNRNYKIDISGTSDGTMNMKVTYIEGDDEEYRTFKNVPITSKTKIHTSATDKNADLALYVDTDGDNVIDEGWEATANSIATSSSLEIMEQLFPENAMTDEAIILVNAKPAGGEYTSEKKVTLQSNSDGAIIYYTLDGTVPSNKSNIYTDPIDISSDTTLKFIAITSDGAQSDVMTEVYTIIERNVTSIPSYAVKFNSNGGTEIAYKNVVQGNKVPKVKDPVKEGYTFDGWYTDKSLTNKYDFSKAVNSNFTLYAKWVGNEDTQIILTLGEKEAIVFGKKFVNDVAPKAVNERTMLPIRFIAEALGAEVIWEATEPDKVLIKRDELEIVIYIGSDEATVNGKKEILDSPAFVENERTYLPLRFVSENLGASVEWIAETQQVIITK